MNLRTPRAARHATRRSGMSRARLIGALAGVVLLVAALVGSSGLISSTDASWTDERSAAASFTALELGHIEEFECHDSESLLGLLRSNLQLTWEPPEGLSPDVPVEYLVEWDGGLLGERGSATVTDTEYLYSAGFSILDVSLDFTVRPFIESWEGDAFGFRAAKVSVLGISVRMECRAILGVL